MSDLVILEDIPQDYLDSLNEECEKNCKEFCCSSLETILKEIELCQKK